VRRFWAETVVVQACSHGRHAAAQPAADASHFRTSLRPSATRKEGVRAGSLSDRIWTARWASQGKGEGNTCCEGSDERKQGSPRHPFLTASDLVTPHTLHFDWLMRFEEQPVSSARVDAATMQ
jgi:hypothetical protein